MLVVFRVQIPEFVTYSAEQQSPGTLNFGLHLGFPTILHFKAQLSICASTLTAWVHKKGAERTLAAWFNWKKCSRRHPMPLAPDYVLIGRGSASC